MVKNKVSTLLQVSEAIAVFQLTNKTVCSLFCPIIHFGFASQSSILFSRLVAALIVEQTSLERLSWRRDEASSGDDGDFDKNLESLLSWWHPIIGQSWHPPRFVIREEFFSLPWFSNSAKIERIDIPLHIPLLPLLSLLPLLPMLVADQIHFDAF